MKVSELIALLQEQPQDMDVLINGYEGGMSDVSSASDVIEVIVDHNKGTWYYGAHEEVCSWHDRNEIGETKKGLVIG